MFKTSFWKALSLTPKHIQEATREIITKIEHAKSLAETGLDVKKMEGQKANEKYYRIRVGDWRIGCKLESPSVIIITILHRGSIYKLFP